MSDEVTVPSCASCAFQAEGTCHFNPPVPVPTADEYGDLNQIQFLQPQVSEDDWCSHYEEKSASPSTE